MLYSVSYVHMYVVCWFIILIYIRNYVASSNTVNDGCVFQSDEDIQAAITAYNSSCGFEAQCTVATNEFNAVTTCEDALQSYNIGAL